jgi:cell wall-associated NlpC family hydrolase
MTTSTRYNYVVAVGVADIRRSPDPASELVTQALLNNPVQAGAVDGEWTHVLLPDYAGWIRTSQLEEPIVIGFCQVGETCRTPLDLLAVITSTHSPLYIDKEGDDTLGMAYLSSALPLLDASTAERVQVALPGQRGAWLQRSQVALRRQENVHPQAPLQTITAHARSFLKRPYLWGGTSWEGIDCSGFVQLCYRMGGYTLPRDADQQHDFLTWSVKREDLRAGDLIFFGSTEITHVAMALNGWEYIHAEGQNYNYVVVNSFDRAARHYSPRLDEIVWAIKRVVV